MPRVLGVGKSEIETFLRQRRFVHPLHRLARCHLPLATRPRRDRPVVRTSPRTPRPPPASSNITKPPRRPAKPSTALWIPKAVGTRFTRLGKLQSPEALCAGGRDR